MVSIRMRASGRAVNRKVSGKSGDNGCCEIHISGAEGIYGDNDVNRIVEEYIRRATGHSRGRPDRIEITVERVTDRPRLIRALPVSTARCGSPRAAGGYIRSMLTAAGVSGRAVEKGIGVVFGDDTMRGAAIIDAASGRRVEPDKKRGLRASRLGISKSAAASLGRALRREGIHTVTVVEAIVLASKVASCPNVVAELCVSDDPDYTTGYVASRKLGYVRIPHIKRKGEKKGGRVFFVADGAVVDAVSEYLEKKAVLVSGISECGGIRSIDEIIGKHYI